MPHFHAALKTLHAPLLSTYLPTVKQNGIREAFLHFHKGGFGGRQAGLGRGWPGWLAGWVGTDRHACSFMPVCSACMCVACLSCVIILLALAFAV